MGIIWNLGTVAKSVRRTLKLSPMHNIFRSLKRYDFMPETFTTLEIFGWNGEIHGLDLASIVPKMEIWEIEPKWKAELKRKFPKAEVKITDSYKEIRQTSRKFDVVIVDNPYVSGNHYEHFDLFPDIFRVLNDTAVIVLIVIPEIYLNIADEWLKKRHSFYTATNPTNITFDEIEIT